MASVSGFANEAHSLRLGVTRAEVEKAIDSGLAPDEGEYAGTKITWQVPIIKRCATPEGVPFALGQKALKEVRSKWKAYTQAERFALSMSCGVDGYVGNIFADKQHVRQQVTFERGLGMTPQNIHALLAGPSAAVAFVMVQTSAEVPDISKSEESMRKP